MENPVATKICKEWGTLRGKQANARSVWQRTGDAMWPYVQIDNEYTAGTDRTKPILDTTPMLDMLDMVSGFKQVLMPAGQTFFVINPSPNKVSDNAKRYLSYLTDTSHDHLFGSNLMLVIDQVLISLITFGPGGVFTKFIPGKGLVYRAPKIGSYVLIEDEWENVIGSIHEIKMSAGEAYETYGNKVGQECMAKALDPAGQFEDVKFLYKVAKNTQRDPFISPRVGTNMAYRGTIVSQKDKVVVEEGGFMENPYAFARWIRPEYERDGRGIGTEMMPQIKILFAMNKDFNECANRWNHPAQQAKLDGVEGQVDVSPDALNWVTEIGNIQALDGNLNGNFPVTVEALKQQRDIIDRAFFKNAFDPLGELKGDRRTTIEIQERVRGTLKRLGPPTTRIWHELLTKVIERSVLELIRNGVVAPPPEELSGKKFGIEYIGPLAMALKSEQARGLQEWLNFVGAANQQFPDQYISDNVDFDEAIPRIGRTFGVNVDDIATPEERDAKRAARAKALQEQKQMQMAESMGKAYNAGKDAPDAGSPAEQMLEQMG